MRLKSKASGLLKRFAGVTFAQAWSAVVCVLVGCGLALLGGHFFSTATVPDQLQQFEQRQGLEGYTPVAQLDGDLKGDGTRSYIFVMRSTSIIQITGPLGTQSDKLVILDDDNNHVHVAFDFQPEGLAPTKRQVKLALLGLAPSAARRLQKIVREPAPYVARIDGLLDVDDSGRQDLVGSWNQWAMNEPVSPRPFVIAWDPTEQRYRMSALLSNSQLEAETVAKLRRPGIAGFLRTGYVRPQTLRDVTTGATFRSVDVDDYVPVIYMKHLVLLAVYVARAPDFADERYWQVVPYLLYQTALDPELLSCSGRNLFMPIRSQVSSMAGAALAFWRAGGPIANDGC